ncbi:MAG: hypothetical protein KDA32_06495 [Phycisphaerales bacterium]|nr:hypothetical protein [Phycisphaerales bacterium]
MKTRTRWLGLTCLCLPLLGGCNAALIRNLTEESQGNVSVQFINNTPFRAVFSFATYDAFDRNPPGPMDFRQQAVEANSSTAPTNLICGRNLAVGTQALIDRAILTGEQSQAGFNSQQFNAVVNFSSAAAGTAAENLPTAGTADGLEARLGLDYSCGDLAIFIFEQDPNEPGGFRIRYDLIQNDEDQ